MIANLGFLAACVGLLLSGVVLYLIEQGYEPPFWAALGLAFGVMVVGASATSHIVLGTMAAWTREHDESAD